MSVDHRALIETLTDTMSRQNWPALSLIFASDATLEYPQSGELFRGIDKHPRPVRGLSGDLR